MTNLNYQGVLNDPWECDSIPRNQFKKAATPNLYGSSLPCYELWAKNGIEYTMDQVIAYNRELQSGALGLANDLKEFIIRNVQPAETTVHIYDDSFTIKCNRYKNVGEHTYVYDIYDSITDRVRRLTHTETRQVPDLEAFRRYFVTLLIHNLDSQVLDYVMEKIHNKYKWGIDIHDAVIINPEAAADVRKWYAEELQVIFDNREQILANYFKSIGISINSYEWQKVLAKVKPIGDDFKVSLWGLK